MLTAIVAGLWPVWLVRFFRLRRAVADSVEESLHEWYDIESRSLLVGLWGEGIILGLRLVGCFLFEEIGRSGGSDWILITYISPTWLYGGVLALAMLAVLVISAVYGSRAKRLQKEKGLKDPARLGVAAKVGLWIVGWLGYLLGLTYLTHVVARSQGMFLL